MSPDGDDTLRMTRGPVCVFDVRLAELIGEKRAIVLQLVWHRCTRKDVLRAFQDGLRFAHTPPAAIVDALRFLSRSSVYRARDELVEMGLLVQAAEAEGAAEFPWHAVSPAALNRVYPMGQTPTFGPPPFCAAVRLFIKPPPTAPAPAVEQCQIGTLPTSPPPREESHGDTLRVSSRDSKSLTLGPCLIRRLGIRIKEQQQQRRSAARGGGVVVVPSAAQEEGDAAFVVELAAAARGLACGRDAARVADAVDACADYYATGKEIQSVGSLLRRAIDDGWKPGRGDPRGRVALDLRAPRPKGDTRRPERVLADEFRAGIVKFAVIGGRPRELARVTYGNSDVHLHFKPTAGGAPAETVTLPTGAILSMRFLADADLGASPAQATAPAAALTEAPVP